MIGIVCPMSASVISAAAWPLPLGMRSLGFKAFRTLISKFFEIQIVTHEEPGGVTRTYEDYKKMKPPKTSRKFLPRELSSGWGRPTEV